MTVLSLGPRADQDFGREALTGALHPDFMVRDFVPGYLLLTAAVNAAREAALWRLDQRVLPW